jgi:phosphoribosyl-AMP cyclohydrolase
VDPTALTYDERGLLPAVVQDVDSKQVLMLAWVDEEALRRTLDSGTTWFWSRSRQEHWNKGATSGNTQRVADVRYDCDSDSVLMLVHPDGPACHTGETSCFYRSLKE